MSAPKSDIFDGSLQGQANLFKALTQKAPLRILYLLAEAKDSILGNLLEELLLGRTDDNQYSKEMKSAGLAHGTICGAKINYCLN